MTLSPSAKRFWHIIFDVLMLALVIGFVLHFVGCASTPQGRVNWIARRLEGVALNGTGAALIDRPQSRPVLEKARDEFGFIATNAAPVTMFDLVSVVNTLPVEKLRSTEARLIVQNGVLFLEDLTDLVLPGTNDLSTVDLRPVATALNRGMTRALGP